MGQSMRVSLMKAGLAMAAVLAAGCASVPLRGVPAERYHPEAQRYPIPVAVAEAFSGTATNAPDSDSGTTRTLKSGDRLDFSLRGIPEPESFKSIIDDEGRVNLPLIGDVGIAGLSIGEARKKIESIYVDEKKLYKRITVIIVPPESEYTVSGEVLHPGAFPLTRSITLSQALARAGRFTEYGDSAKVRIYRGKETIVVNFKQVQEGKAVDPVIVPGDVIEVPRHWY